MIQLSAILSSNKVSFTGPTEELRLFQEWLGPEVTVKYAAVNAWYHGGDQLESVAEEVIRQIEGRQIEFPGFHQLQHPLRSSYDGSLAKRHEACKDGLARWVVWHMLIYSFDWPKTSDAIVSDLTTIISTQTDFRPLFISFGPSSEWLLGDFKSHCLCGKFDIMDMSAFHPTKTSELSKSHQDDIAIVGMGVHFPKGHGQEELWNTLVDGTVAFSDVGTV